MRYQFTVQGPMSDEVVDDLPELSVVPHPTSGATLFGPVRDEADVFSLRTRLIHHGLRVVEVRPLPD